MLIGVDFDNTIVCYDALFHKVACEQNCIPAELPVNKSDVRNYLRKIGQEEIWTEMQGTVYGGRMSEAAPYPGVIEFFQACRKAGIDVRIISHKTQRPFLGEQYDLHQSARAWLEQQGFFDDSKIGLPHENVFFELTKQAKLERIGICGCTHFIDDLPEFLAEPSFPKDVQRILFDPNDLYVEEKFTRIQAWSEAQNLLLRSSRREEAPHFTKKGQSLLTSAATIDGKNLQEKIAPFLRRQGIGEHFDLEPLSGGRNNRVYRLIDQNRIFALKEYFKNPADTRDRFGAEHAFYQFLWGYGIRRTPEPFAWDAEKRFGLFSFINGRKLLSDEVNESAIKQAADFIVELNRNKNSPGARNIPNASEACFSISEHLDCVQKRVDRLKKINVVDELDQEALDFVREELEPFWIKTGNAISHELQTSPELNKPLTESARCLSPSDFGFHNALLVKSGQILFLDFEYAGWDDPAKLICDFFCQPQLPANLTYWNLFIEPLARSLDLEASLPIRARLLLPAYQIKWCCIMMNEFIRSEQARRDFAHGGATSLDRKRIQLDKSRHALRNATKM